MRIFQHVQPLFLAHNPDETRDQQIRRALDQVRLCGFAEAVDRVLMTHGDTQGKPGGTNTLKILSV